MNPHPLCSVSKWQEADTHTDRERELTVCPCVSPCHTNIFAPFSQRDTAISIDSVEAKYRTLYEQSADPFTQFNRKVLCFSWCLVYMSPFLTNFLSLSFPFLCQSQEKQNMYSNMTYPDRITLHSARFFLQKKYLRLFLFFYALALHVLVFFTLFTHTHC